jgi:F-type H+-transporting ATPase subunit gamma
MASLLTLKSRIRAARNVSKTTKAMQMIAASKLKKAQEATLATRPYLEKLTHMNQSLITKIDQTAIHPYITANKLTGKTLTLVLAPDKGLCGGLITNLMREFLQHQKAEKDVEYIVMGKKVVTRVAHFDRDVIASFNFGTTTPTFDMVYPLSRLIDEHYLSGRVDTVKVLYTNFTSLFTQTPKIATLLPLEIADEEHTDAKIQSDYVFEPSATEILPELLKHYLEMSVYQYLLESFVSEQAARMIAMQNATDNANDIISDLQLEYNKTRQAKITSEILDLGSGGDENGNKR